MKSAEYLRYYSSRFDTVEVDSTFYRCPTIEAVKNWSLKTPPGFVFSLKILKFRCCYREPQQIRFLPATACMLQQPIASSATVEIQLDLYGEVRGPFADR